VLWAEHVAANTAGERDEVFAEVRREFSDAELVELTGICGLFAVSNRFQDSMRLPIEEQGEVDKIRQSVRADPKRLKAYIARLVEHWPQAFPSSPTLLPEGEGSFVLPSPPGRGRAETWSRSPIHGDATVEARNSTRDFGALHPATGSHPSAGGQWNLLCPPRAQGEGGLTGESSRQIADAASTAPAGCRVPLLDPALATGDTARFFAAAERLLGSVPNTVRVWGHVPHVGKLVLPFFIAVERAGCGGVLPAALKVLVIARISHINSAPYTLAHALAVGNAEGVTGDRMEELSAVQCVNSPRFSASERAALVWAQHVAQNTAKHHDAVFEDLRRHFNDAEIVELTGLCAETNMVNRFCNALRVPVEPADELSALYGASRIEPARLMSYLESVLADWPRVLPVPDATAT